MIQLAMGNSGAGRGTGHADSLSWEEREAGVKLLARSSPRFDYSGGSASCGGDEF